MRNKYSASAGLVFLNTLAAVALSNHLQNVFHLSSMMTNSLVYCSLIFSLSFRNEWRMVASHAVVSAVGDVRFFASCFFLRYGRVSL